MLESKFTLMEIKDEDASFYTPASNPILEGMTNIRSRCLVAVVLGCNTFPKEMREDSPFHMGCAAIRKSMSRVHSKRGMPLDNNVPYVCLFLSWIALRRGKQWTPLLLSP